MRRSVAGKAKADEPELTPGRTFGDFTLAGLLSNMPRENNFDFNVFSL